MNDHESKIIIAETDGINSDWYKFVKKNMPCIFSFHQNGSETSHITPADAIVTAVGVDEEVVYAKSTALQVNRIDG